MRFIQVYETQCDFLKSEHWTTIHSSLWEMLIHYACDDLEYAVNHRKNLHFGIWKCLSHSNHFLDFGLWKCLGEILGRVVAYFEIDLVGSLRWLNKNVSVARIFKLGWGIDSGGWTWRLWLFVWKEELVFFLGKEELVFECSLIWLIFYCRNIFLTTKSSFLIAMMFIQL
jgi:hypothetical protein